MSEAELHILKERMYQGKLNKARRGELLGIRPDRLCPAPLRRVGDRPRRAGPGDRPADLRPVRPRGDLARPAPLPGPPRHPHPGPAPLRAAPRGVGVAAAQPGDAAEPPAPPDLRRGLPITATDRSTRGGSSRAGRHRQADPSPRGVPGADPGPPAGLHHAGTASRPTRTAWTANRARPDRPGAPRQGASLLAGLLRCGRCGRRMAGAVLRTKESALLQLHARVIRLRRAAVPEPRQGRWSTTWSPGEILAAVEPAGWRRAWRPSPRWSGSGPSWSRHWQLRRERARYEVERAARQYQACEPENRLVARELERRWEESLKVPAATRGGV